MSSDLLSRWRGRHSGDRGSSRYQGHNNSRGGETDPLPPPPDAPPPPNLAQGVPAVLIDDLLSPPQRAARPARLVIILRGPPGSGKTFVAKLIKDKEVEMGGSAPRILSLDDYFMVEVEKEDKDPETGRKITTKVMEYEYEAAMEKHYQSSLLKAFKKTVNDGYFPFIIVDCINDQVKQFEEMWSYAKQKGFQVYICETDMELAACFKRNIHNRSEEDISKIIKNWEDTPKHYLKTDVRSLLQAEAITEVTSSCVLCLATASLTAAGQFLTAALSLQVEMEDTTIEEEMVEEVVAEGEEGEEKVDEPGPEIDEVRQQAALCGIRGTVCKTCGVLVSQELSKNPFTSKWEWEESAGDKLKRLDGLAKKCKGDAKPQTLEDWLQLTDCYDKRQSTPGKKRVRWADLEERREQEKMRAIGFVVGQTDWTRMTDPTFGQGALTQTKYI
uniref:YLP motif-containing protein 1 n=1 Tax=Timema cristinae TaxID=61476 RepID=A0A7R9DDZ4_TIMCR|nr:unnamed protein product [Timema cristinae]